MKEALLWEASGESAGCLLCNHFCVVKRGCRGRCGVRENRDGRLYSLSYGRLAAEGVDPIEKKPFFHFLPSSLSYSISSAGCNFSCGFCQNYMISQSAREGGLISGRKAEPEDVVSAALSCGCSSISYTYTEPTVFFEFALETAMLARKKGLMNNFVTNGYMSGRALEMISPYLDAANVDLKGDDSFYREICGARMGPVVENIGRMKKLGIWVEVTTLLVPGYNDSDEKVRELAGVIRDIDPFIPWHVSRFFPAYRMSGHYPGSVEGLERARKAGFDSGLKYVYAGNVPGSEGENTFCHSCGSLLIKRYGFRVSEKRLRDGMCPACNSPVAGVFKKGREK